MRVWILFVPVVLIGSGVMMARAEQAEVDERLLTNRLNNLESQAVQRRGREPALIDLLNRQDDRAAGQALNMLKTKRPRDVTVPSLERQLLRSRRPGGRLNPR